MADKIKVSFSRTINLGNYESTKIEAAIEEELKEGDEPYETVLDALFKEVEDFVLKKCEIEVSKKDGIPF